MTADVETVVVGAGVVGLAIARALALAGHEVMVLEQHDIIGSETSSRNSEVIHAGIYYPPGSLRAQAVRRGQGASCTASAPRTASPTSASPSCWSRRARRRCPSSRRSRRRRSATASRSATADGRGSAQARAGSRVRRRAAVAVDGHRSTATASCWRSKGTSRRTAAGRAEHAGRAGRTPRRRPLPRS